MKKLQTMEAWEKLPLRRRLKKLCTNTSLWWCSRMKDQLLPSLLHCFFWRDCEWKCATCNSWNVLDRQALFPELFSAFQFHGIKRPGGRHPRLSDIRCLFITDEWMCIWHKWYKLCQRALFNSHRMLMQCSSLNTKGLNNQTPHDRVFFFMTNKYVE